MVAVLVDVSVGPGGVFVRVAVAVAVGGTEVLVRVSEAVRVGDGVRVLVAVAVGPPGVLVRVGVGGLGLPPSAICLPKLSISPPPPVTAYK